MNKKHTTQSAFFNLRISITLLFCGVAAYSLVSRPLLAFFRPEASTKDSQRTLTFGQRVTYQRAIEEVYWRHRIWPKANPNPKPPLDAVMSRAQLEKKVEDYLRESEALEDHWQRPIIADDLQAEMDRMARDTRQPEVLRELFDALGNDPFLIAECLARPVLSKRLITSFTQEQQRAGLPLVEAEANSQTQKIILANVTYTLPTISDATTECTNDSWTPISTANAPDGRLGHTAVWTGSEMIVWGGYGYLYTGGRYNPSTDSWTATSTTSVPEGRYGHTAVWTGSEMIVWGGQDGSGNFFDTGGKYNPGTDSWTATSTTNAPSPRAGHTAVWTGSEMIVWGADGDYAGNTGGRYNPSTDSWTATTTTSAPDARYLHTAVWTGSKMVVWGGIGIGGAYLNTGGRYDATTDSWTATNNTNNTPRARYGHTAVWTGSKMIVWGGVFCCYTDYLSTGGRYNPTTDAWAATSDANPPHGRSSHTAVWTGTEMIVWGGLYYSQGNIIHYLNTGGRYSPDSNSWTTTSINNAPTARYGHTAVWTGSQMIVWGGFDGGYSNTGERYCAQSTQTPSPTPSATGTPTATATPTATSTPTSTPTPCTGRCEPTPRPRPTPAPRP
jgi:N-acetylneuraminic acid mutarotase